MNFTNRINNISSNSVGVLSFGFFYIWMMIKASLIFIQFSSFEIVLTSIIFLGIFLAILKLFRSDFYIENINLSIENVIMSAVVVLTLILFADLIMVHWMKPGYYYPFFPLMDTELGMKWDRDTVFHCATIQSILNFGYPSVGLHDTPLMVYHVLSHYIDAFVVLLTGLEVFDSYGLFFYFKTVLLLSSILAIVTYMSKKSNVFIFLTSLLVSLLLIVGSNGIAIGSHGLWFTSIIVILSFYKVFTIITKEEYRSKNFLIIFIFIIFISFGKISTGFMYAVFIGFVLWLRFPKNMYVYITGVLWVLFFYLFQMYMIANNTELNLTVEILTKTYQYLLNPSTQMIAIFIYIGIIFIQTILMGKDKNFKIIMSMLISLIILAVVIQLNPQMTSSDIYYFEYGYGSILVLVIIYNLFKLSMFRYFLILFLLMCLNGFLILPDNMFDRPNKYYADEKYKNKLDSYRELYSFRDELMNYMKSNELNKNNTLLYVPKDIYINELSQFKGRGRTGFLVYALTGVPLLYGVSYLALNYGYADYTQNSLWLYKKDFVRDKACMLSNEKNIIMVQSVLNKKFLLIKCKI